MDVLSPIQKGMEAERHLLKEYGFRLDWLTIWVKDIEEGEGASVDVMTLKDDIMELRQYVDSLKSVYIILV